MNTYHLDPRQMTDLLNYVQRTNPRLHAMILLAWRHGLRASEVCGIRVSDLDMRSGYITIQRLKGSLKTTQPLFDDERAAVTPFLVGRTPNDFVFPGRYGTGPVTRQAFFDGFQKACVMVGIPDHLQHPHVLKHTTGMTVIPTGIENCRQYLGHKSIASTGAYLKVGDDAASRAAKSAFGVA